jgi:stearoyl-CoA desaturase (delta-9 desaturase)
MLYGRLNFSWWECLLALLVFTQITIAAVTLYLHRSQAHRSVDFHPAVSHFFRFWLWLTTGMNTKEWVAIHRKHHIACETEDDPHSPQVKGIKKVFFQGTELYRAEAKNQETLERYGKGTPEDWLERHVYTKHPVLGIGLMLTLDLILFGVYGITLWAIQMMWIPLSAAGFINGVGHYWGYRNFECADASRNITCWGLLVGGEELHNNHHTYPTSAKLSVKWWELDIGWTYITLLKWISLAKVKKVPPKLEQIVDKKQIDIDTLRALFANPLQIMAHYSNNVLVPVFKQEYKRMGDRSKELYRRGKKLLVVDSSLMDAFGKQSLNKILQNSQTLAQVYQFRIKLQAIWNRSSTSQNELLDALQEWCKQAEATGLEALQQFVRQLKTYVPKTV